MDGSCVTKINTASVRSAAVESEGQNRGIPSYRSTINRGRPRSIEESRVCCLSGFWKEELEWLSEHLKKVVELEASRGFIRKIRGKTRTHLMEICFNSRGRFMKITEFVTKRKTLILVVLEGVKGNGWEALRKAISSMQDFSNQVNGALLPVGKWVRAVICESKGKVQDWVYVGKAIARMMGEFNSERRVYFSEEMVAKRKYGCIYKIQKGLVRTKRSSFSFVGRGSVEIHSEELGEGNEGDTGLFEACRLVEVSVIGEDEEVDLFKSESTRSKDELMSAGGCVSQSQRMLWATCFGPPASPIFNQAHETEPKSSKSDPVALSSSKLQCSESSANEVLSIVHSQESSKIKGPSVVARRKARNWPPCLKVSPFASKRKLDGGVSMEANLTIFWSSSVFNQGVISPVLEISQDFTVETKEDEGLSRCNLANKVCLPFSTSFEKGHHLARAFVPKSFPVSSVSVFHSFRCQPIFSIPLESNFVPGDEFSRLVGVPISEGRVSSPEPEPLTLLLEGFQIEGLMPKKMVKVQSVLESLRIRIIKDNGKGAAVESRSTLSADKETKREIWDRRFVSSVWKGTSIEWATLPACGASGEIVIMWDSNKLKCTEKVLGYFSVSVKLNSGEEGSFWLTSVYGLNKPLWMRDFWLELQDLLTFNIRCFDEFIRESGLLDPPLRNTAFTWSNMQVAPISKRFENMWLPHPKFKENFSDWWQECTVEGWEGVTLSNIAIISKEIVNFFGKLYSKPECASWRVKGLDWVPISGESAVWLDRHFSEEECWDVIKEDLMRVFLEFHINGIINQRRLRKVLHETIFGSQGAFVEGRHILDVVLIANEVVDEKRRKGFNPKWRSWMRGCLSSSSFAILVNGNANSWVKVSRGLRQGDPISPFLFTLVADVLSRLMIRAKETRLIEGFFVGRDRTRVSLLQFADDTIFFFKASLDHLQNLKLILLVFGQVSGLKINLEKSTISGLPLGGNPKTIGFWDPVVERISKRLDGWKKAFLSLGGRITLIQSSLSHVPSYFLSLFKIPVSIASKIEKLQRDFLWFGTGEGKKDHLIRWDVVCRPKELGGLGFGKISLRNIVLLRKWLWRFPRERNGLWHKLLRVFMRHILMDGTPTWWLDSHTDVLGRLLLKFSKISPILSA
ncbi:putative ribonuclease H protein [Vitis vinifera]|uniref:Putative ribonuclease H protein n=1 Tax=Vitis vinifera TaxID=29760 RepID=A0A438ITE7_VITVI|nr:putative ribonuclease H protein [Vitis vinifera]